MWAVLNQAQFQLRTCTSLKIVCARAQRSPDPQFPHNYCQKKFAIWPPETTRSSRRALRRGEEILQQRAYASQSSQPRRFPPIFPSADGISPQFLPKPVVFVFTASSPAYIRNGELALSHAPTHRHAAGPCTLAQTEGLPLCSWSPPRVLAAGAMAIGGKDIKEDLEEAPPLLLDEAARPRRVALFVEPSPFAYISGYKNRFQNFIKHLREMGDEVIVVTNHEGVPEEFHGAKVIGSWSFPCPMYGKVPLSLALSPRIISEVAKFKPDIIHASSPGIMVFGALAIAKLLSVPLVMSYHTHVPVYIPRYTFSWLVEPMWQVIRFLHRAADLTLVPSAAISKDFETAQVISANRIRLWNKGVDSASFHPRFRNHEMRIRLSDGEPEKPLIIHVGRFGREKNLDFVKMVMDRLSGVRIAFIGDGPYRTELEKMFEGMPAVFTGMMQGEELSQAYASGDVFIMPSESETLGQVVLESMSSGVPVVAARAGGIPDIIPEDQEGKTSFLFTPGDLDDCVGKVQLLLTNREFRDNMAWTARAEMEKCDWRAASSTIRNEFYNAAIWYWRKKRADMVPPLQWLAQMFLPGPEVRRITQC